MSRSDYDLTHQTWNHERPAHIDYGRMADNAREEQKAIVADATRRMIAAQEAYLRRDDNEPPQSPLWSLRTAIEDRLAGSRGVFGQMSEPTFLRFLLTRLEAIDKEQGR